MFRDFHFSGLHIYDDFGHLRRVGINKIRVPLERFGIYSQGRRRPPSLPISRLPMPIQRAAASLKETKRPDSPGRKGAAFGFQSFHRDEEHLRGRLQQDSFTWRAARRMAFPIKVVDRLPTVGPDSGTGPYRAQPTGYLPPRPPVLRRKSGEEP